jgi:hypothetical protein
MRGKKRTKIEIRDSKLEEQRAGASGRAKSRSLRPEGLSYSYDGPFGESPQGKQDPWKKKKSGRWPGRTSGV